MAWMLPAGAVEPDSVQASFENRVPNWAVGNGDANIGIVGKGDTVRGLQLNLLFSYTRRLSGLQITPTLGVASEMKGVQIAGLSTLAGQMNGFQLAVINNSSLLPMKGFQLSGISNVAAGVKRGMQLSTTNISDGEMRGLQLGGYNFAHDLSGAQIGVINAANKVGKGWQVGLVNYSRDSVRHKLGLVNIGANTKLDFMAFGGTASKINFAARFRNKHTYSMVGVGLLYTSFTDEFSGSLFYRYGAYKQLSPKWMLSADAGFYHVESFEKNTSDKSRDLYSLQAHFNVDYQLSPAIGIYASAGVGETRFWHHNEHYKTSFVGQLGLTYRYNRYNTGERQHTVIYEDEDGPYHPTNLKRKSWVAAAEVTGINVFVHCFDRFVTKERFAMTTLTSIRRNFKTGFVWDNDFFSTNLFAHPYHGNLYFNAARSTGHNFWQSVPFTLGGSLMWEFFGEKDPPAINDVFATTMGGVCLGEITYRLSDYVLNNKSRGFRRFLREAAATVISPMKGFNRICTGDAWRISDEDPFIKQYNVRLRLVAGGRYVADNGARYRGDYQTTVKFDLDYGDPLDDDNNKPYDYFNFNATFGFGGNQPIVSNIHVLGRLWGVTAVRSKLLDSEFGIFQHFNYYNSEPVRDGSDLTPFKISEAASLGPGFIFRYNNVASLNHFEQRFFISGILLGGSKSDYYNVLDRDYNMGSGFSVKAQTIMAFSSRCDLKLGFEHYQLYTWKGYSQEDLETVDPFYLNAQGDRGRARLEVLSAKFYLPLKNNWGIEAEGYNFYRRTHYYDYGTSIKAHTFEFRLGLCYDF